MGIVTTSHTFEGGATLTEVYQGNNVWAVIFSNYCPDLQITVLCTTGDHAEAVLTFQAALVELV